MDKAKLEDIENRFSYHPPNDTQIRKVQSVRGVAGELAELIISLCPDSREASLAITNIEQAVMWANAAIARHSGGK